MFLYHFEIIRQDLDSAERYQWASDEDEAFALLWASEPVLIDQERVAIHDVLFEVVNRFEGSLVYWMEAGEA